LWTRKIVSLHYFTCPHPRYPLSRTFTPPHHDTARLDKPVVRFFPIRHLADIEVSRQLIFAGLFSTRKRTIVNNLALTKFFHTCYFESINTRHHNDIIYTNSLYTGSSSRISCSNLFSTNIMRLVSINAR
jgi:hypothetical protein